MGLDVHIGTALFDIGVDFAVFDEGVISAIVSFGVEDRILFDFDIVVGCGIGFGFDIIGVCVEYQIEEAAFVYIIFVIILGGGGSGDIDEVVGTVERVKSEFRVAGGFKLHVEFCGAVDRELQIVDLIIGAEITAFQDVCLVAILIERVFADNADRFVDQTVGAVFLAVGPVVFGGVEVKDVDGKFPVVVFVENVKPVVEFAAGVVEGEIERIISADDEEAAVEIVRFGSQPVVSERLIFVDFHLESSVSGNRTPVVDQRIVICFARGEVEDHDFVVDEFAILGEDDVSGERNAAFDGHFAFAVDGVGSGGESGIPDGDKGVDTGDAVVVGNVDCAADVGVVAVEEAIVDHAVTGFDKERASIVVPVGVAVADETGVGDGDAARAIDGDGDIVPGALDH